MSAPHNHRHIGSLGSLIRAACLVGLAGLLASSRPAVAQDRNNFNASTWNMQLFRPAIDSRGYVTMNSSRTLGHLDFSIGLVGTWAYRPLYMQLDGGSAYPGSSVPVVNSRNFSVDHLVTPQLMLALGLFDRLEIALGIPIGIMIGQRQSCQGASDTCGGYDVGGTSDQLHFTQVTLSDLPIHIKGKLIDPMASWSQRFGLGALLSVYLPISHWAGSAGEKAFLGEGNVTIRPELIVEREWDQGRRFRTVINVGALVRFGSQTFTDIGKDVALANTTVCYPGDSTVASAVASCRDPLAHGGTGLSRSVGTQVTFGLGLAYAVVQNRLDLLGEVYGYADVTGNDKALPLEGLLAMKIFLAQNSFLMFGGGAGILGNGGAQTGSPRARGFIGFVYEPRIGDRDGDGIKDNVDQCPDEPEDRDGFQDEDGCPDLDNDGDGIPDSKDKCPNVKGTWEKQGCPSDFDSDGDGIPDSQDKCPNDPEDVDGFEDDDGCPDLDNDQDGIPDHRDRCPNEPETKNGFEDNDGCPDGLDKDKDGIPDAVDKCPDDPEDKDGFEDSDGCPELDNDKDRIPDKFDKCPNEPETYNGVEDEDGCPDAEKGRVMVTNGKIVILDKVFFDTGKTTIKPISFPILDAVTATLKGNPQLELLEIQGHADERGDDNANLKLTQGRVQAVKDYLVKKGVAANRLEAKGYGETKPLCTDHNEACWEKNRRVEFVILKPATEGAPAATATPPPAATAEKSEEPAKKKKKKGK